MSPDERRARVLHSFQTIGQTADEIEWWRQGVPLADGVRLWDQVTHRPAVAVVSYPTRVPTYRGVTVVEQLRLAA